MNPQLLHCPGIRILAGTVCCRCIGGYPDHWEFSPEETSDKEPVVMSLDEFETIRLLDYEGCRRHHQGE